MLATMAVGAASLCLTLYVFFVSYAVTLFFDSARGSVRLIKASVGVAGSVGFGAARRVRRLYAGIVDPIINHIRNSNNSTNNNNHYSNGYRQQLKQQGEAAAAETLQRLPSSTATTTTSTTTLATTTISATSRGTRAPATAASDASATTAVPILTLVGVYRQTRDRPRQRKGTGAGTGCRCPHQPHLSCTLLLPKCRRHCRLERLEVCPPPCRRLPLDPEPVVGEVYLLHHCPCRTLQSRQSLQTARFSIVNGQTSLKVHLPLRSFPLPRILPSTPAPLSRRLLPSPPLSNHPARTVGRLGPQLRIFSSHRAVQRQRQGRQRRLR
ncbi:hypothetical protein DFJ73DRAFT_517172 [Zopfochytrium polystomum]|nr:hypothetical protein DFJ73DRAFT_517172 [Zopfochytrium polystomum]